MLPFIFFASIIVTLILLLFILKPSRVDKSTQNTPKDVISDDTGTNWPKPRNVVTLIIVIVVLTVVTFFTDTLYDFNWTSIPLGQVTEREFGQGSSKWIWAVIGSILLVIAMMYIGAEKISKFSGSFFETVIAIALIIAVSNYILIPLLTLL